MKGIILSAMLLLLDGANAQNFTYPTLVKEAAAITNFIPSGWILLDSVSGDLNADNARDYALALQYKDSIQLSKGADTVLTQPRVLAIMFWDHAKNNYQLEIQNNTFLMNHDTPYMTDPYAGMEINANVLRINIHLWYSAGSWWTSNVSYSFRYKNSDFELIGFGSDHMHRATQESESNSVNFLTKKYSITKQPGIEEGNEEKQPASKTVWKKFKIEKLKTLRTLGKPFEWEFAEGIQI